MRERKNTAERFCSAVDLMLFCDLCLLCRMHN